MVLTGADAISFSQMLMVLFESWFTGKALAETILEEVERLGLDMEECRGQSYDGAANMAGAIRGCSTIIQQQYPLALYQHCKSHCLNLAVMKVSTCISKISE